MYGGLYCPHHVSQELEIDYIIRVTTLFLARKATDLWEDLSRSFVPKWNSTKLRSNIFIQLFIPQINIKYPPRARHCTRHRGHSNEPDLQIPAAKGYTFSWDAFLQPSAAVAWGHAWCLALQQQPSCPSGEKSHHTEDDKASKQKETSLNECEQLKAPKQFAFSGQGFSTSNSQSLLSEH